MRYKKRIALGLATALLLSGCGIPDLEQQTASVKETEAASGEKEDLTPKNTVIIDENKTYQTWEGFGASSAWWSQYVGGWDQPYTEGELPVREQIAQYLFSKEDGIGLTIYRYNVGAGSADSYLGDISDKNRRAQSFIGVDGEYNWDKDKNAVWFMNRAVELGVTDVVFFCNSPLEKFTTNGLAHMSEKNTSNLSEENYGAFAAYVMDVAKHFREEGIPVTSISPINEPQWDWLNGQEGCHYEPEEVVGVLNAFLEEMESRDALDEITLSSPESGEWGGNTRAYVKAILEDETLGNYFKKIDIHSYWSDTASKEKFKEWIDSKYPGTELVMSEWCEMVNGKDYTMDSAFNMADVITEDISLLNVVSWQYWVAVADGDYRDGLIYVNKDKKACRAAKRLWGYGNYTRYIRPGYVRVDLSSDNIELSDLNPVAFSGVNENGKEETVLVLINRGDEKQITLDTQGEYQSYQVYTTNEERDLENTASGNWDSTTALTVEGASIVTIVLEK